MKNKKFWVIGISLIALFSVLHWNLRPRIEVKYEGAYLSDRDVLIIRNGVAEKIRLDENGRAYLNYSDWQKTMTITMAGEEYKDSGVYWIAESGLNHVELKKPLPKLVATAEDLEIIKRLERIGLYHVELTEDTTLRQAMNFLSLRLREGDPPSPLSDRLVEMMRGFPDEMKQMKIGKLRLRETRVAEVMDVLFLRCGRSWNIVEGELVLEQLEKTGNLKIQQKLDRIILDKIEFHGENSLRQVINFMRLRARELDDELDVNQRGIGFVYRDTHSKKVAETEWGDGDHDSFNKKNRIEDISIDDLCMYHLSMREALTLICRRGGLDWHVGKNRIIFSRND